MKLRIRANTLRLRLTQTEVAHFAETGAVSVVTRFGPTQVLRYALRRSGSAEHLHATFESDAVTVHVPAADADAWATTDRIGLAGEQATGEDEPLLLLVEKDFHCLHREASPEDADTYPHPDAPTGA